MLKRKRRSSMILLRNRNTKTRQYDQFLSSAAGPLFLRSMASNKILLTKHTIRSLSQPRFFSSSAANKTTKHKMTTSVEKHPNKKKTLRKTKT
jgi:lantibiotic modifying enzyme